MRRLDLAERRDRIISLLSESGDLSAAELSERLSVSVQTIRTDLRDLDEAGLVQRRFKAGIGCRISQAVAGCSVFGNGINRCLFHHFPVRAVIKFKGGGNGVIEDLRTLDRNLIGKGANHFCSDRIGHFIQNRLRRHPVAGTSQNGEHHFNGIGAGHRSVPNACHAQGMKNIGAVRPGR